jgi:hypothetical protein
LFEAKQYEGKGPFRYNASFCLKPGGDNDKRVQAGIREAAADAFGKKADAKLQEFKGNKQQFCYLSGDTKDYPGYKGALVLTAHRKQEDRRPLVIDGNRNPVEAKDGVVYDGCYVNATLDIWAQVETNQGIRCTLKGIQKAADGEPFGGGRVSTPDDFDDLGAPEGEEASDLV